MPNGLEIALEYRPLSVGIHPPGFRHRDAIRPGGALFFSIEVKNHWLERLREQDPRAALRPEISNSELSWLALRLYRAMKRLVDWIASAKKEETRAARIEKAVPMLAAGKRLM